MALQDGVSDYDASATEERCEFHKFRLEISSECCPRNDGRRKQRSKTIMRPIFFSFNNDDYRFITRTQCAPYVLRVQPQRQRKNCKNVLLSPLHRCCTQLVARSPGVSGEVCFNNVNVTELLGHISWNRQNSSPHRGPRRQFRERPNSMDDFSMTSTHSAGTVFPPDNSVTIAAH